MPRKAAPIAEVEPATRPIVFFIPRIRTEFVLDADWTFSLYNEHRNREFGSLVGFEWMGRRSPLRSPSGIAYGANAGDVTLPKGSRLKIERIYVKQESAGGSHGMNADGAYNSITVRLIEHATDKTIKGRFWVKLADFNLVSALLSDGEHMRNTEA